MRHPLCGSRPQFQGGGLHPPHPEWLGYPDCRGGSRFEHPTLPAPLARQTRLNVCAADSMYGFRSSETKVDAPVRRFGRSTRRLSTWSLGSSRVICGVIWACAGEPSRASHLPTPIRPHTFLSARARPIPCTTHPPDRSATARSCSLAPVAPLPPRPC